MLRYIYASDLGQYPVLQRTMFADRADQFHDRLGWDVSVDDTGAEMDEYDHHNPLYVMWQNKNGCHGGSMRFLPTVGPTMVNDHFGDLTDNVKIESPLIWECTRFCLAPGANHRVSAALMLAGLEVGLNFHLTHSVGVFDARMVRVYRRTGWAPTVLGTSGTGIDAISAGLWEFDPSHRAKLLKRAGVSAELSSHWFNRSFGFRSSDAFDIAV